MNVRGGAASIAADCADMQVTASVLGSAGDRIWGDVIELHQFLFDVGLLESAVLDPVGAWHYESALASALDGPHGLSWLAAECTALQVSLTHAAESYLVVDSVVTAVRPISQAIDRLPQALLLAGFAFLGHKGPSTKTFESALEELITQDPALADLIPMALTPSRTEALLTTFGGVYPDGRPVVTPLGTDRQADASGPPRDLAGVIGGLVRRNEGKPGEVDVRIMTGTGAGGRPVRSVVVDVPGTKSWNLTIRNEKDVTNLGTNLRALAGETTTYERGVIQAMKDAGVRPDDDVTIVGHSQGGMIAVNAARDLAQSGDLHVNRVITAGAPVGNLVAALPKSVQVLALENSVDLVPHADGAVNPDLGNVTTVTFDQDHGHIGKNHDLTDSYLPGARAVQASSDRSIRAFLGGLSKTFEADSVHTQTYVITRTSR